MATTNITAAVRAWRKHQATRAQVQRANDAAEFYAADQAICPELWASPDSKYGITQDAHDDAVLEQFAARFGVAPDDLDTAIHAAFYDEEGRMLAVLRA